MAQWQSLWVTQGRIVESFYYNSTTLLLCWVEMYINWSSSVVCRANPCLYDDNFPSFSSAGSILCEIARDVHVRIFNILVSVNTQWIKIRPPAPVPATAPARRPTQKTASAKYFCKTVWGLSLKIFHSNCKERTNQIFIIQYQNLQIFHKSTNP